MKLFDSILSWLKPDSGPDSNGRVKCKKCRNRVQQDIAADNGGLCGVCHRKTQSEAERQAAKDARFDEKCRQEAAAPISELDEVQKRSQLAIAIAKRDESRIDALLASGSDLLSEPAKYSSNGTWLGDAIDRDCSFSILEKLVAAGCHPNTPSHAPNKSRPLGNAIQKERIDIVTWLLAHGADPNLGRPLIVAVDLESPELQKEMLTVLLKGGANINNSYDWLGDETDRFTVLDFATAPAIIAFLKENGAKHYAEL